MLDQLDLEIGTLSFFAFSFLAGVVILLQAILGSKKETMRHRIIKATVGAAYAVITVLAFMQLEGVKSPYVDAGQQTGEIKPS